MKKANQKKAQAQDWQAELAAQEALREKANQEAMEKAQEAQLQKAQEAQAQKAQASLAIASRGYQEELEPEIEKALEKAYRARDKAQFPGEYSKLGHRRGSEGSHMDNLIWEYIQIKAQFPNAKQLKEYAREKGYPMPYAIGRIKGHLNHLQKEHNSLIPAIARQALKAGSRQDNPAS